MRRITGILLAITLGLGCASQQTEPAAPQQYTENARRAYLAAMDEFNDRAWESAVSMFDQIKREYTYSRYSRLAELRLADIEYEQQKYAESVSSYRSFVHDHPNDPEVPYARFRVCKALFEQTGESVLLPPLEERELAAANDAYAAIQAFINDFPLYERKPEAAYMLEHVTGLLCRHELYVARFYLNLDKFAPAADRILYALEKFRSSGLEPEALVLLGETRLKMHQYDEAKKDFMAVLTQYPASAFTKSAQRFLDYLKEHPVPTTIAEIADE